MSSPVRHRPKFVTILHLIFVVIAVSFLTFVLLDIAPGDPAALKAGVGATQSEYDAAVTELGLDRSLFVRYSIWLKQAATGDFGDSWILEGFSVSELIGQVLPQTIELILLAEVIALALTIPLSLWVVRKPDGFSAKIVSVFTLALFSTPAFVLGLVLSYIFGVQLGWFPTIISNLAVFHKAPAIHLRQILLPSLVLALGLVGIYVPVLRNDLTEVLTQDYIMMARARGIDDFTLLTRHTLGPSVLNLVTALALNLAGLIAGTFVIEVLFAINGMGRLLIQSVLAKDYPTVAGCVTLISVIYVIVIQLADITQRRLDPRTAHV